MSWRALEVARWEFIKTVRERAFIVSTLLTPILILVGMIAGPPIANRLFSGERQPTERSLEVQDEAGLFDRLERRLAGTPLRLQLSQATVEEELVGRLTQGEIDGYLTLPHDVVEMGEVSLVVARTERGVQDLSGEFLWVRPLQQALQEVVMDERLVRVGISTEQRAKMMEDITVQLAALEFLEHQKQGSFLMAIALIVLLLMTIASGPTYLMLGVLAEKSQRMTEMVVAAIPVQAWMDGKILGYSGVAFLQALVYGACAGGLALLAQARWRFAIPVVDAGEIILYVVYFLLGVVLYNTMFAALSATLKDLNTSSGFQGQMMMLIFLGFGLVFVTLNNPEASAVRVLSFIPFWTPLFLPVRLALVDLPSWEIAATLLVLVLFTYLMRRFTVKIFRVGMLMYGQQATLKDLIRWLRR